MRTIDIIVVVIYMLSMLGVGVYARSKINDMDDFILGGKRFTVFPLTATIMTTLTGAGMTIGMVGAVAKRGSGIVFDFTGVALGLFFMAVIAKRLRKTNKRSLAEVIAGRFGKRPQIAVAVIAAFYTLVLTGQNVAAVGRLIRYMGSDMWITPTQATIVASVILTLYTALGGLYAVVWTDAIQFVIMLIAVVIIGPVIAVSTAGGIAPIAEALSARGVSLFSPFTGNAFWPSLTLLFIMILGVPGDPTSPQRALAAKDSGVAKKAFMWAGLSMFPWAAALILIGGASVVMMPDIAAEWGTTEAAFPLFAIRFFPPVVTGMCFAGMFAAVMSTADSMLLLCTTHIIYDIGMNAAPDVLTEKRAVKIMPVCTILLGALALFVALRITSLLATLYFVFSMVGGAFIVPTLAQLYFPDKCTEPGIIASVLVGGAVTVVMYQAGVTGIGGDPVYTGLAASALCIVLGNLFAKTAKGDNS